MLSRPDRLKFASQINVQPPVPLIAPTKGWNTRDALDAMDPADAVTLDNWYPDASGVLVRNGFTPFASIISISTSILLADSSEAEYASGSPSAAVTGGAGVGAGIIVALLAHSANTITALTDSVGNTYSKVVNSHTHVDAEIWYNGSIASAIVGLA